MLLSAPLLPIPGPIQVCGRRLPFQRMPCCLPSRYWKIQYLKGASLGNTWPTTAQTFGVQSPCCPDCSPYNTPQLASHSLGSVTPELKMGLQAWSPSRTHLLCPGVYTSSDTALGCFCFCPGTSVRLPTPSLPSAQ